MCDLKLTLSLRGQLTPNLDRSWPSSHLQDWWLERLCPEDQMQTIERLANHQSCCPEAGKAVEAARVPEVLKRDLRRRVQR